MNNKETQSEQQELPEPTRAQLEILQVLWKHGPSTVRFVNDQAESAEAITKLYLDAEVDADYA